MQVHKAKLVSLCHQDQMRVYGFHPLDWQDSLNILLYPAPSKTVVNIYYLRLYSLKLCLVLVTRMLIAAKISEGLCSCTGPREGGKDNVTG